jgi:hypothetical protein
MKQRQPPRSIQDALDDFAGIKTRRSRAPKTLAKSCSISMPVANETQLPHWQEALQIERERQEDFDNALGEVDREIALAELKAATARREWTEMDLFYFGGWLGEPKKASRRRRPADPEIAFRDKRIAAHSLLLEQAYGSKRNLSTIVDDITSQYRVGRSSVFNARQRWCPQLRKLGFDKILPEERNKRLMTFIRALGTSW